MWKPKKGNKARKAVQKAERQHLTRLLAIVKARNASSEQQRGVILGRTVAELKGEPSAHGAVRRAEQRRFLSDWLEGVYGEDTTKLTTSEIAERVAWWIEAEGHDGLQLPLWPYHTGVKL